jgi:hypothetical protein
VGGKCEIGWPVCRRLVTQVMRRTLVDERGDTCLVTTCGMQGGE